METLLLPAIWFLVAATASTIGAISGIGGGVIIKPVMDSLGTLSVPTVSFLSGCTVLAMSTVSLARNLRDTSRARGSSGETGKTTALDAAVGIPLSLGAVFGGIAGKELFQQARLLFGRDNLVGMTQAAVLLAINLGVLFYMLNKTRITTRRVGAKAAGVTIGFALGVMSSFLGIGGGPINIAVLHYFYSMQPKETTINSLFVIFCSQLATLVTGLIAGTIPAFPPAALLLMAIGGVSGSLLGTRLLARMRDRAVETLFIGVLVLLMALNVWNIIRFAAPS